MWTADSTQITADQTCWTADGYNGCNMGGGYDEEEFMLDAVYEAYKLAIYKYYGIKDDLL